MKVGNIRKGICVNINTQYFKYVTTVYMMHTGVEAAEGGSHGDCRASLKEIIKVAT